MRSRWLVGAGLLAFVLGAPSRADAQPTPYNLKYNAGQSVQPIFEGWSRHPDGGYTMHFGYLNRNFVEEIHVPIGPDNRFEATEIDAGQPTFFYPRIHRRVFSVRVPADFGDRQLVWKLTVRGETLQSVGWLDPTWETEATAAGRRQLSEEEARNTAPTLQLDVPAVATVGTGATLTARVTDDGLPAPRDGEGARRQPVGQEVPPALKAAPDAPESPDNVPDVPDGPGGGGDGGPSTRGLRVLWTVWRGPAGVAFEPSATVNVEDGQAVVTATFTTPGDYVLRALANDGRLTDEQDVTVAVR